MTGSVLYAREDRGTLPIWHRVERTVLRHGERLTLGVCGHGYPPADVTARRPPTGSLCAGCRAYEEVR